MDLRSEQDIERLRQVALLLEAEVQRLLKVLQLKSDEIDRLRGESGDIQQTLKLIETLREQAEAQASTAPGSSSEGDGESGGGSKGPEGSSPRKGHGPRPQPNLPTTEELFVHDEADRMCPCCGGRLEPLEGQFETSELVDVSEVEYRLIHVLRQKYVCDCGGAVETAPGPDRAIDGGRYSLRFAAKVAVDKYDLALPLARQERAMRQMGLDISRTTLWDQLFAIERPLRPVYDALRAHILSQDVIGLDQTSWPCLSRGRTTPWQMWCLTSPDAVYHAIRGDKAVATFRDLLDGFQGVIVCDALSTHIAATRTLEGVQLAHCFAHVVRRFKEAAADFPQAQVPLALLRKIFDIDARAEADAHRRQLRASEARPVMDELKAWLTNTPFNKTSSLGQAIRYTVGIWPGLNVFLENERVWLDNNRTERSLRGPVVGRKNHYGSKSRRGTQVASTFYSLIETAKLHRVPPHSYLVEAVQAGRRGEILLPWQMAG